MRSRALEVSRKVRLLRRLFQGGSITWASPKRAIRSCFTPLLPGMNSNEMRSRVSAASTGSIFPRSARSATETRMERFDGMGTQPLLWSVDRGLRRLAIMSFGKSAELSGFRQHMREAGLECSKNIGRVVERDQHLVIEEARSERE